MVEQNVAVEFKRLTTAATAMAGHRKAYEARIAANQSVLGAASPVAKAVMSFVT